MLSCRTPLLSQHGCVRLMPQIPPCEVNRTESRLAGLDPQLTSVQSCHLRILLKKAVIVLSVSLFDRASFFSCCEFLNLC